MKSPFVLALLFALAFAPACGGDVTEAPPGDWKLVWSDEFDADGLPDAQRWAYDTGGHGWGNNELQFYTARRPENARVEGGKLIIEARREAYEGRDYTSARLFTRGKADWTYGRVEVSARLPGGRGVWPAIWMLPTRRLYGAQYWPDNGEIDIMEYVGFDPGRVHASVHTLAYNHVAGTQRTASIRMGGVETGFHRYAVEWEPDEIRGYLDDQHYFTFKNERLTNKQAGFAQWPFDRRFYLLLNVAVGGNWGGQQGVDADIWPQRMEVDYVRVYQREGS